MPMNPAGWVHLRGWLVPVRMSWSCMDDSKPAWVHAEPWHPVKRQLRNCSNSTRPYSFAAGGWYTLKDSVLPGRHSTHQRWSDSPRVHRLVCRRPLLQPKLDNNETRPVQWRDRSHNNLAIWSIQHPWSGHHPQSNDRTYTDLYQRD